MDLPEPARAHDVGDPARVGAVGLVALGGKRRARMAGLQTDGRQTEFGQLRLQPG